MFRTCGFIHKIQYKYLVGFEVLTAVSMKMADFWVLARTSETLVNFYRTTRRYSPEDSHLQYKYLFLP
jgi:hypothetical protein